MYRECRHIKVSGGKCNAAALKGKDHCYFHSAQRRRAARTSAERWFLDIPFLEDRATVQLAISEVADSVSNNRIDVKRAGLLLYALQIAAQNLKTGDIVSDATVRNTTLSPDGEELAPIVQNTSEDFASLLADSFADQCVDRLLGPDSYEEDEEDEEDEYFKERLGNTPGNIPQHNHNNWNQDDAA